MRRKRPHSLGGFFVDTNARICFKDITSSAAGLQRGRANAGENLKSFMKSARKILLKMGLAAALIIPLSTSATSLLVEQASPYIDYGYGLGSWNGMTAALNSAFGAGNITVNTTPLNNLAYLLSFDRLWITAPQPGDPGLTATEIANVQAFIATGRRVVLIGENNSWASWNNSILQTVGGTYTGIDTSDTLTPSIVHPLTAGISSLSTVADGLAIGGTSLFSENVATLWGPSQNVVSLLSVNVIDDFTGSATGNQQFKINLANWLVVVPEPSAMSLMGLGVMALLVSHVRNGTRLTRPE